MKQIFSIIFFFLFYMSGYSQIPCPGLSTVVYAGKTYHTVAIGNQCWLVENLDVGKQINGLVDQTNNDTIEKYCYNNDPANCVTYGGLYQWAEAVQYKNGATNTSSSNPSFAGNVQGICPPGWHLPVINDFNTLASAVNNDGNSLKAVGQGSGIGAGTNTSGFAALLAGTRFSDGTFSLLNIYNFFVTTSEKDPADVYFLDLGSDSNFIFIGSAPKSYGRSVRCIQDLVINNKNNCPESQGFWKNHSGNWPGVFPMMLGTLNSYSQSQLLSILKNPVRGDASIILAYQLISAKLNVADNSKLPAVVQYAIIKADNAIGSNKIPAYVRPNSRLGLTMIFLADILGSYNNGRFTPECRKHDDHGGKDDDDSDVQTNLVPNDLNSQNNLESVDVSTPANTDAVDKFELLGNFPNPFNPTTQIKFLLPDDGLVTLKIYNVTGQLVRTLVNEYMSHGSHTLEWNATNDNGFNLPTGIYFYRLQAGSFVKTSKMIYMK
jgi:uncharacterized protein (TIGR02145 family)